MGVAQITRRTSQNFDASLCNKRIFWNSSICCRVHCEGSHCPRSSTQIDRPSHESCAGIGCLHPFESALARPAMRSRVDRSAQLPSRANMRESPVLQGQLESQAMPPPRRRATGENRILYRCERTSDSSRPSPGPNAASLAAKSPRSGEFAEQNSRERRAGAGIGASVAFWTRFCRAWKAVQQPHFRADLSFLSVACGWPPRRAYRPVTETWPSG